MSWMDWTLVKDYDDLYYWQYGGLRVYLEYNGDKVCCLELGHLPCFTTYENALNHYIKHIGPRVFEYYRVTIGYKFTVMKSPDQYDREHKFLVSTAGNIVYW